jgi:hypothetical protein
MAQLAIARPPIPMIGQQFVYGRIVKRRAHEIWGTKARGTPAGNGLHGGLAFVETLAKEIELGTGQPVQVLVAPAMDRDFVSLTRDGLDEVGTLECEHPNDEERGVDCVTFKALKNSVRASCEVIVGDEWHSPRPLVVDADHDLSARAKRYTLPV